MFLRSPLIRSPLIRSPLIRSPLIRSPLIRSPLIRSSLIRLPLFFTYPLRFALPNVAIEIATLRGYRMTFSHSSKDPLRPLT